jgi:hypothetical protein
MNDNVPLSMVKRRLHNKNMMEMAGEVFKKGSNRKRNKLTENALLSILN